MLPSHIQGAMDRYVQDGISPGGFLTAVLSNNLKEAFMRADSVNLAHMKDIIGYCYYEIPSNCWGSSKAVREWKGLNKVKEPCHEQET